MRNSWRYEFLGGIAVSGPGCWLTGTVGPAAVIPIFSALWLGFVSLFFIGGSIGLLSDAVTGRGFALLPFVLIPGFMIVGFVVLTEVAARSAAREWERMDQWLRALLEVPENPWT
jgi:ascorbate-specific PTS system EIIC-type component UlaA